jgi:ATP-dependent helicase/nuclease subunit A
LLHHENHQQNFIAHFGYESLEILDKFLLSVSDFCQKFSPNLQKFLEFVDKLDVEIALSSDEDNRVKISTIHSAKGLQARIVVLPDCCYNFNQLLSAKEQISWVQFDEVKLPIWCAKKEEENFILKQHRAQKLIAAKEEYLRLLYVAMTRAEDELYVGGFGKASDPQSWYEIIKNSVSDADFVTIEELLKSVEVVTPDSTKNDLKLEGKSHFNQSRTISKKPNLKHNKELSSQTNQSQIKGRLIHKILEVIGKNHQEEKNWLQELAKKIINREEFLSQKQKSEVADQITNFIFSKQFEELFFGDVKCEVEIAGSIENKKINCRIDLLIERENEILIIDYKSDETLPNNIPQQYLDQLKTYQQLIKNLYPNYKIKTAIFWTNFLKLQPNQCCDFLAY